MAKKIIRHRQQRNHQVEQRVHRIALRDHAQRRQDARPAAGDRKPVPSSLLGLAWARYGSSVLTSIGSASFCAAPLGLPAMAMPATR
jgi:hypothetical protein